jgi:hypothetical protein
MHLLVKGKKPQPICRECRCIGRPQREKPNWICRRCFDAAVRHAVGRLKRVRGFPPRNPIVLAPDIEKAVAARWLVELDRIIGEIQQGQRAG